MAVGPLTQAQLEARIDAVQSHLFDGSQWEDDFDVWNTSSAPKMTISYQFAGNSQPGDLTQQFSNWTALTSAEKEVVRDVLEEFEEVINVDFVETATNAKST